MTVETTDSEAMGLHEMLQIAVSAQQKRDYLECQKQCARVLERLETKGAGDKATACMALELLGDCLSGMEQFSEAAIYYVRALDMGERLYGNQNQVFVAQLYKVAITYEKLSLLEECEPLYKRSSEMATQVLSSDHPLRATINEGYDHLLKRRQKRKEKVGEIMDSFRRTKDRIGSIKKGHTDTSRQDPDLSLTDEEVAAQKQRISAGSLKPIEHHIPESMKDLRSKTTTMEGAANTLQTVLSVVLAVTAVGLIYMSWQFFGKNIAPAPTPSTTTPTSPTTEIGTITKMYSSLDGIKVVKIGENGRGVLELGGISIPAKIEQPSGGGWGASSQPSGKDDGTKKVILTETRDGLVDEQGTPLYPEGAPEFMTKANMKSVAGDVERTYMLRGSFPQSADALRELDIRYKNSITGAIEVPIIQTFKGDQGWNPMNPMEKSAFEMSYEQGGMWQNEPPLLPGAIHMFVLCKPDANPDNLPAAPAIYKGLVVFIHAGDRKGNLLMLETKKAYLTVLKPGSRVTTSITPPSVSDYGSKVSIVIQKPQSH